LTLAKTPTGVTIKISKDEAGSPEQIFDYIQDLSGISSDSTIAIIGGGNTASVQYSEIDYFRINNAQISRYEALLFCGAGLGPCSGRG
jgi:hypothetical protein